MSSVVDTGPRDVDRPVQGGVFDPFQPPESPGEKVGLPWHAYTIGATRNGVCVVNVTACGGLGGS